MTTQLTAIKQKREKLMTALEEYKPKLVSALPSQLQRDGGNRWIRALMNCVGRNPKLTECSAASVIGSALLASEMGFDLNPVAGHCALIPYKIKGNMTCTLQPQYQGLVDLAYRTGRVKSIYAHEVRENDDFQISYGTDKFIRHVPKLKDRGEVLGYYAVAIVEGADPVFEFMTLEECRAHRDQYSKGYHQDMEYARKYNRTCTNPWVTNEAAMCKKTVVKKLMPWLPKSAETVILERAVAIDTSAEQFIPLNDLGVDLPEDLPADDDERPQDPIDVLTDEMKAQEAAESDDPADEFGYLEPRDAREG